MRPPAWLIVVLVGAALGLVFAGVSTYDFVQHLDRQVHTLHCSFIPGMSHSGTGESGCQVAMMSAYSSVFRTRVWGGIPISLPAMAVFAFIGCFAVDLMLTRRKHDPRATGFLALACALPVATSALMATISLTKLGTACKLCIGIYVASAICLLGAVLLWRGAVRATTIGAAKDSGAKLEVAVDTQPASGGFLAGAFAVGVAFVLVPVVVYVMAAPDHSKFVGSCDGLARPNDDYGVMVPVEKGAPNAAPAVEVLDPLCPACKAFEERLTQSGLRERLDRKAILFPLDSTCNWMITETTHPGACTVSEAVLCAGDRAPEVLKWAFEVQDRIREEAKADPTAAAREVKQRFPDLAACVGSPEAKQKLNKSLRWAVGNNVRVLTPQLYVDNVKLCDEDVDLGLEYALTIMLDRHDKGTLAQSAPPPAPAAKTIEHDSSHDNDQAPPRKPSTEDKPVTSPDNKETKPADKPPADKLPAEDKQPAEKPPAEKPPAEKPPAEKPPAEKPADKPVTAPSETGSGGAP